MHSWLVIEKLPLIFFLIPISRNGTWTELGGGRQGGKTSFYLFIFFCINFFVCFVVFLPSTLLNARLCFHIIHPHLIIQHKVSFSSRFIFSFLKINLYIFTCDLLFSFQRLDLNADRNAEK